MVVTRGNRRIAEIRPAARRTGRDLAAALAGTSPPDDGFADDVASAVGMLTVDEADPWTDE